MSLFGDPRYPRRNIGVAAVTLALTSFLVGTAFEHIFSAENTTTDYINLVIWFALFVLAIIDIRLVIISLPPDAKDVDTKTSRVDRPAV